MGDEDEARTDCSQSICASYGCLLRSDEATFHLRVQNRHMSNRTTRDTKPAKGFAAARLDILHRPYRIIGSA
jgi:hypothetical protein